MALAEPGRRRSSAYFCDCTRASSLRQWSRALCCGLFVFVVDCAVSGFPFSSFCSISAVGTATSLFCVCVVCVCVVCVIVALGFFLVFVQNRLLRLIARVLFYSPLFNPTNPLALAWAWGRVRFLGQGGGGIGLVFCSGAAAFFASRAVLLHRGPSVEAMRSFF